MRPVRWLALVGAITVASCATLNENECRTVDWRELGRTDGSHGYAASRLGEHQEACGEYHIQPDPAAYRAGRDEGLRTYCVPDNAIASGRRGDAYNAVCPGELDTMFNDYYARGQFLRSIDSDLSSLQSRLNDERSARDSTKELDLYKQLERNVRYLERQQEQRQRFLSRAEQAVAEDRRPPRFDGDDWQSGIPYPEAASAAREQKKKGS
jgi:hypothetical protein